MLSTVLLIVAGTFGLVSFGASVYGLFSIHKVKSETWRLAADYQRQSNPDYKCPK